MDINRLFVPRDEDCPKVIEEIRWGGQPACPYCNSTNVKRNGTYQRESLIVPRYKCNNCGKTFSPLTGTVFERHKLSLGEMFYIIKHMVHMSANEIASDLNLDYETVENFVKDVMEIAHGAVSIEKLCAIIEIDEIYVNSGEKGKKGV